MLGLLQRALRFVYGEALLLRETKQDGTVEEMSKDREVILLAIRIRNHAEKMRALVWKIEETGHPNALEMIVDLRENQLEPIADPVHVVSHSLENPDRWDLDGIFQRNK